jgi:hypothetical protein
MPNGGSSKVFNGRAISSSHYFRSRMVQILEAVENAGSPLLSAKRAVEPISAADYTFVAVRERFAIEPATILICALALSSS